MAYCPDYSPLWTGLTVDQHVQFVGQLRGLSRLDIHSFKTSLYHDLDLTDCRSLKVKQLSEGDKRKVSFAMSMVGTQTVMFVENPSMGMDTRSRRLYWDAVNYFLKASHRCTVLSTQCVEEAEKLSTRVAVMVNGQFRCLGTPEELKSRCERMYRLEVNLGAWDERQGPRRMDMLVLFLQEMFPGLQTVQQFQQRAVFRIYSPAEHLSLATTFHTLESLKRNLGLENFTFSQLDLEQVFLDCALEQNGGASRFSANPTDTSPDFTNHNTPETTVLEMTHPPELLIPSPESDVPSSPTADVQPLDHTKPTDREGSAKGQSQGPVGGTDMAVGVIVHDSGDDSAGGVEGLPVGKGEETDAGAAAPVVFSLELEGMDNPAYTACDEETYQTYL